MHPVIAEIVLETGTPITIAAEPVSKPGKRSEGRVVRIDYDDVMNEVFVTRETGDVFNRETYRRSAAAWTLAPAEATSSASTDRLRVWVNQSATERPKLYAAVGDSPEQELYDPAPEFDRYAFGRQEAFSFQGKERTAALIYPVGYREGQRHPFILQTHGLGKNEFVLEGPKGATPSYAAQVFAER